MRNSRLIGGKPKIGIRPIIDGRRGGIRESLEDMTMAMAHKVAELYSSVLRHSDGTTWLQHWQAIHRRDCLLLAFTDVMYRR